ncbi:MAG: zinc-binding dehydrogenase [Candidatus Bathyarchaeota archaeon]|nr:MAG: zinc-binding dehydrogenase [Candidatus Bathyarchaeota archaeon]
MNTEKMQAALLYGERDLRIGFVNKPQIDDDEVLVKIRAATTCGTDLKIFQRGYVNRVIALPTIFGHEWAGDVTEVGDDVSTMSNGMRVRAGNSAPCLRCRMCQKGRFNLCEDMLWLWGAYAEYIRVPARTILVNSQEIPENVTYEEAALAEPLACVLHGVEESDMALGDTVVIIGAGPIGLLHLLLAKRIGVEKTIMCDIAEERLIFAEKLGADATVNSSMTEPIDAIRALTNDKGADVVVEAIGLPATWKQSLKMVSKGGTVLEFGGCPPGSHIQVDAELLHYDEVTIMGTFHATPTHFKNALNLISSGTLNVKPLITKRMPLTRIKDAFTDLISSKSDLKIAIIP